MLHAYVGWGRGLPDVSLDMDFHYPIYYGGSILPYLWGGTSFAAPEWTDASSGSSEDFIPDNGDTFTVIAQGTA